MVTSSQSPDTVVEIELCVTNTVFPIVGISGDAECRLELEALVTQTDKHFLQFCRASIPAEEVLEVARDEYGIDGNVVTDLDQDEVVLFRVEDSISSIPMVFSEVGAVPRQMVGDHGQGRVILDLLPDSEVAEFIDEIAAETQGIEVIAKRRRSYSIPLILQSQFRNVLEGILTDRQKEVLRYAYLNGYFERPRDTTGRDLAAQLGITQPTFSQHLRSAQQKVFTVLFEEWLIESPGEREESG